MLPFVYLYIYLFVVWLISAFIKSTDQKRLFQCIFGGAGLLLLLGFHSPELGTDVYNAYIPYFESASTSVIEEISNDRFEPLFAAYVAIIKNITANNQVFLFITALFILCPILILVYRHSDNPIMTLIVYASWVLYHFSFSGIRQAIAVGVICIASLYMFRKRLLPFVACVLIATAIHTSALLFLVAYPMMWAKFSERQWTLLFLIIGGCMVAFPPLILSVVNVLFPGHYSEYIENVSGGYMFALLYLLIALIEVFMHKGKSYRSFVQFTLLLFVLQLTGIYSNVASRIGYYFIPLFLLSLPAMVENVQNLHVREWMRFGILGCCIAIYFITNSGGYLEVIPFKFFWQ